MVSGTTIISKSFQYLAAMVHTSYATQNYIYSLNIKFTNKNECLTLSSDLNPIDYLLCEMH